MKAILEKRKSIKSIAWILIFAILLGSLFKLTVPVLSEGTADENIYVMLDGEKVSNVVLDEDAKLRFEAYSGEKASAYQWQIKDPKAKDRWINVSDGLTKYLWVTNALVGSMLNSAGVAELRCRVQINSEDFFTSPVKVVLSLKVPDDSADDRVIITNQSIKFNANKNTEHKTYSIVINYLFDNIEFAFVPYGASVAAGSDFVATI